MSNHVINVSEADFQYEVLAYSSQVPVVVDFWAEWCGPCHMLTPILEKLAEENQGAFRLAKVDVDANQKLAMQYGVQGIPAVKAFRNGQIVAEFTGAQPEPQVRQFLSQLTPSPLDLLIGKGTNLLGKSDWDQAEESFREALDTRPGHDSALLGLAKSLIAQGEGHEALEILQDFPAGKSYNSAENLLPVARAMVDGIDEDTDELAPAYARAVRLVELGNIPAALDGLLDILREDKTYRDGQARHMILGLFELLDDEAEETRNYRNELASLLF
ncbi:MAG: thioredoxin [Chloroflexi bacterium]|nr:MAG: thioredoxin [Chloroflexota bacterium]MBL1197361.1 thioredoxin [Chloroflexota bacterium]NOH14658.1 thioredoxin [Chloroflexota bacterium]